MTPGVDAHKTGVREKTPGQLLNEYEELLNIEQQRAKQRMAEGGKAGKERVGNVSHPSHEKERARDKAAEKLDTTISGDWRQTQLEPKQS